MFWHCLDRCDVTRVCFNQAARSAHTHVHARLTLTASTGFTQHLLLKLQSVAVTIWPKTSVWTSSCHLYSTTNGNSESFSLGRKSNCPVPTDRQTDSLSRLYLQGKVRKTLDWDLTVENDSGSEGKKLGRASEWTHPVPKLDQSLQFMAEAPAKAPPRRWSYGPESLKTVQRYRSLQRAQTTKSRVRLSSPLSTPDPVADRIVINPGSDFKEGVKQMWSKKVPEVMRAERMGGGESRWVQLRTSVDIFEAVLWLECVISKL